MPRKGMQSKKKNKVSRRAVKYISKRIGCTWCKKEMTFSQWEKHIVMNKHLDKAFENAYMWKYGRKKNG